MRTMLLHVPFLVSLYVLHGGFISPKAMSAILIYVWELLLTMQVIGMATVQPLTDVSQLQRNFSTTSIPGLNQEDAADKHIMQLTSFCLNPIFAHRAEQLLLDILKRCHSSLLLYLLQPDQPAIEAVRIFR